MTTPALSAVPCETCGEPTTYTGTKRCNGCWEVESRLADYVRRGGVKAQARLIAAAESAALRVSEVSHG